MNYLMLLLRNVWVKVAVWTMILVSMTAGVAWFYIDLYPTDSETYPMTIAMENPAMISLVGPMPPGTYTTAVMFSHNMLIFTALIVGIFNVIIANQASKREETSGMTEVLLVSKLSHKNVILSQFAIGLMINIPYSSLLFVSLEAIHMNGATTLGNAAFAFGIALFGLLFYTLAMLFGAVFERAETAFGVAIGVLVMGYLYRAITDVSYEEWSVLSPYHWLTRVYHYSLDDVIWLLPLIIGIPIILIVAIILYVKRDMDSGYITSKVHFKPRKIGSYAHLQMTQLLRMIVIWIALMFVIGGSYGSVFGDVNQLIENNAILRMAVSAGQVDEPIIFFLSMISIISALIALIPGILIIGRVIHEEKQGTLELIESGSILTKFSRRKALFIHMIFGILVSLFAYFASLVGMYAMSQNQDTVNISINQYSHALFNEGSAIILVLAFAGLLLAIRQSLFKVIWLILGVLFFINYLGEFIQLGDTISAISPFHHLGNSYADGLNITVIIIYLALTIIFTALAIILYKRRDLVH